MKVQVRVCHTFTFCHNLAEKVEVWQALTWTFTFLVGTFAIFGELSNFSLLGRTSSILKTFLGGTSQKNHPVQTNATFWPTDPHIAYLRIRRYGEDELQPAFHHNLGRVEDEAADCEDENPVIKRLLELPDSLLNPLTPLLSPLLKMMLHNLKPTHNAWQCHEPGFSTEHCCRWYSAHSLPLVCLTMMEQNSDLIFSTPP